MDNKENNNLIVNFAKSAIKWKIYVAVGIGCIVIFLVALIITVMSDPIATLFGTDESLHTEDERLSKAQKAFKERINEVAEAYEKKNKVKIDKSLLIATVMYSGDYDDLYEADLDEDLDGLADLVDSDDIEKEFGLNLVGNGFKKAWEWYMENVMHMPVTVEGIQRQALLKKYRMSKGMLTRICDAMVKDKKVDLDYFEDNLTETIVPSLYESYLDTKNPERSAREIAQTIIYELADMYRTWIEDEDDDTGNICKVGGSTQATSFGNLSTDEFIQIMGPIAQADYSRTGILASITLAQGILESGWGKSALTVENNNMFGIKCNGWPADKCSVWNTREEGPSGSFYIDDAFRKYDSVEESIADHSTFLLENSNYNGILDDDSYLHQITVIKNGGYATAGNYISSIVNLIEMYELDKWDVKTNTTSQSKVCITDGLNGWNIRTIAPTRSDPAFTFDNWDNVGQCVWYAKARAIEITMEMEKNNKIDAATANQLRGLINQAYGNGGDIYDMAVVSRKAFKGSSNIREPKSGSYIVWKQAGNYGHVAIVEEVNTTDGTITITEGWATGGASCPATWNCVAFQKTTIELEDFYQGYGAHYTGNYEFSGYVYFLEPEG